MRISKGVSSVQVAISIVIILIIVGGGAYYFLTLPPSTPTTVTVTSTTGSTVTSTATTTTASTVTVVPTQTATPAPTFIYQRNSGYSDADPRDTSSIDVTQQSYETLTYLTPNGTIIPGLATSWKSINGTTWEYTLRQGVTFHDGTSFNATDVIFSITNTIKQGGGDAPVLWDIFKSAVAKGPFTVDLTFTQPTNAPIITSGAYSAFIFSRNILKYSGVGTNDTSGLHAWFNKYNDDGSGPYVHNATASSLSGGVWVLNAYKNYWGGWKTGQIQTIIEKLVTSVPTAINLAQQGQLDWMGVGGNFQYVPQLLAAGLNVVEGPSHATIWLLFNTQHPYLNNSLVRQALLTAVNFPQIVQQAYYNYGINYNGMIYPGLSYYDAAAPGYGSAAGNLTAAKALLVKAGFPSGQLPGVTWVGTHSTGSPFEATIFSLLNTYWAPLGAQISITGLSFTNQAIRAGYINGSNAFSPGPISYAGSSKAQDLALLNWSGVTPDPWLVPDELLAIQSPPYQNAVIYNWSYWQNSTFTNLLNQFRLDEANPTQAAQDVKLLNQMFYSASPAWPMFQESQVWVIGPHWHGYVPNPNYAFDYPFFYQLTYSP